MSDDFKCPKCSATMEPGVVWERGHLDRIHRPKWLPVNLKPSDWLEKLSHVLNGDDSLIRMKEGIPIITLRCPTCGYLESYAPRQSGT